MTEAQPQQKFPERIDLTFQAAKAVKSRKTGEDLLVIEARDPKSGSEYSIWVRKFNVADLLIEVGEMVGTIFEASNSP